MAPTAERALTYPVLDTLRFVGALGVVVTHVGFQTGQYGADLWGTFVARLDSGVALFFVLSGFLLSRPFLSRMARQQNAPHAGHYAWKRFLRIAPAYLITVVAVLVLMPPSRGPFWPHWVENLTLTTIYTPGSLPQGLTQMWSLATEVAFYLVLPLLMALVARFVCSEHWRPVRILGVLAALCLVNVAWLLLAPLDADQALWLPAFLSWFSAGMALAVVSADLDRPEPCRWSIAARRVREVPAAATVAALALLLVASTPIAGPIAGDVPTAAEAITKNVLYASAALLLVAVGIFAPVTSRLVQAMSWGPLRYLGRISYGVFCVHLLVLYGVFQWRNHEYFTGHFIEVLVLTLTGSLALSAALYAWIEVPAERLRGLVGPKTAADNDPRATAITS